MKNGIHTIPGGILHHIFKTGFSDTFKDYFSVVIAMIQYKVFLILKKVLSFFFGNVLNIFISDFVKGKITSFTNEPMHTESENCNQVSQ